MKNYSMLLKQYIRMLKKQMILGRIRPVNLFRKMYVNKKKNFFSRQVINIYFIFMCYSIRAQFYLKLYLLSNEKYDSKLPNSMKIIKYL